MTPVNPALTTLPVPQEFVIATVTGNVIDNQILHIPAVTLDPSGWAPLEARAKCGATGFVYARSGSLAGIPDCPDCLVPKLCGGYASTRRYNHGCRCMDCTRVNSEYRRARLDRPSVPGRVCPQCGGPKSVGGGRCRACYAVQLGGSRCGSDRGYRTGCRCDGCRDAHRAAMRDYRERKAA